MINDFLNALVLLTIFPVRRSEKISARSYTFFPLIGLLIGAILAVIYLLLHLIFPNIVTASLLVAIWIIFTGALHLDGFADACDGLFAAATPERRLEILHDVHLGTFGSVGLILLLIIKVSAVANLPSLAPLVLAPMLGRWSISYAAVYPLARTEGMAVLFRQGLSQEIIVITSLLTIFICVLFGWIGIAALVAAFIVASIIARSSMDRLGGLTGDIYGMICESVEVCVLITGLLIV